MKEFIAHGKMFESCQRVRGEGHKCSDVTEKLVHLFGWRQTYKVEKLQRSLTIHGKQLKSPKEVQNRPVSVLSDISKSDVKKSLSFDDSCLKETVPHRYPQQFQRNKFQKSYLSLNSSGRVSKFNRELVFGIGEFFKCASSSVSGGLKMRFMTMEINFWG